MATRVVKPENLGSEFDQGNIEASKIRLNIDGTTITKNGSNQLQANVVQSPLLLEHASINDDSDFAVTSEWQTALTLMPLAGGATYLAAFSVSGFLEVLSILGTTRLLLQARIARGTTQIAGPTYIVGSQFSLTTQLVYGSASGLLYVDVGASIEPINLQVRWANGWASSATPGTAQINERTLTIARIL